MGGINKDFWPEYTPLVVKEAMKLDIDVIGEILVDINAILVYTISISGFNLNAQFQFSISSSSFLGLNFKLKFQV